LTLLTVPTLKKIEISKIQDGGSRHLEKSKNRHISAAFDRFWRNLAR